MKHPALEEPAADADSRARQQIPFTGLGGRLGRGGGRGGLLALDKPDDSANADSAADNKNNNVHVDYLLGVAAGVVGAGVVAGGVTGAFAGGTALAFSDASSASID